MFVCELGFRYGDVRLRVRSDRVEKRLLLAERET
jgi:hypothetical protein